MVDLFSVEKDIANQEKIYHIAENLGYYRGIPTIYRKITLYRMTIRRKKCRKKSFLFNHTARKHAAMQLYRANAPAFSLLAKRHVYIGSAFKEDFDE